MNTTDFLTYLLLTNNDFLPDQICSDVKKQIFLYCRHPVAQIVKDEVIKPIFFDDDAEDCETHIHTNTRCFYFSKMGTTNSSWINHVRNYAITHNVSLGQAVKLAIPSYRGKRKKTFFRNCSHPVALEMDYLFNIHSKQKKIDRMQAKMSSELISKLEAIRDN